PSLKVLPPLSRISLPSDMEEISAWLASDGPADLPENSWANVAEPYRLRRSSAESVALAQYTAPRSTQNGLPPIWACLEEAKLARALDQYQTGKSNAEHYQAVEPVHGIGDERAGGDGAADVAR